MAYSVAHLNSPIIFSFAVFLNGKNVFKKRKTELYEKKTMKQNTYKENMRGVFFFSFSLLQRIRYSLSFNIIRFFFNKQNT